MARAKCADCGRFCRRTHEGGACAKCAGVKEPDVVDRGCSVNGCENPHERGGYCYSHYMKWWRYGDAEWVAPKRRPDLQGRRFGLLTAIKELDTQHWACRCECGRESRVRTWSLTSGSTTTCGHGPSHHRLDVVGYFGVHGRLKQDRGPARLFQCVDCSQEAAQWSYDHNDAAELVDEKWGPYSLEAGCYSPRCIPCHKRFDLDHLAAKRTA